MKYPKPSDEEVEKVPKDILDHIHHLKWDVTEVGSKWNLIDQIYNGDGNWELLKRASAYGYKVIFDVLIENTILSISRLTDPAKTGRKENLTFVGLQQAVIDYGDDVLQDMTVKPVDRLLATVVGCRDFRNQVLAHIDKKIALGSATQLEVKYREIWDFLDQARDIISNIRQHFDLPPWEFDMVIDADASGIVKSLRALEEFRELRKAAVRERISEAELRQRLFNIKPR